MNWQLVAVADVDHPQKHSRAQERYYSSRPYKIYIGIYSRVMPSAYRAG